MTREEAVNWLINIMSDIGKSQHRDLWHYEQALAEIKKMLEEEPQWIPCSERLPKDGRQVLVYARSTHYALAKYDEMREADGTYKKQWVTFDAWKPFYTIKEVLAWMPLPEPYRKESEDDG